MDITITKPEFLVSIEDLLSGKKSGEYLISASSSQEARKIFRANFKQKYDYKEGIDYKIKKVKKRS
jgi:hypothetical protein